MSPEESTEQALRAACRLGEAGRVAEALQQLLAALEVDPLCREALVHAGDLYNWEGERLGLTEAEGSRRALPFYDRAISAQPDHAEAYAEKARALFFLDDYPQALACADQGLAVLDSPPSREHGPDVWVNIGEALYGAKARSLRALNQADEGRRVLEEGLHRFPESRYLTQFVEAFLPRSG